nr:hypothetical protein [uncultured Pseudomonas sp.]
MDKVYRLLPWLRLDQAADWLRSLTQVAVNEDIVLSLCEAGRISVYVNVGSGCSGNDEETWTKEVSASGYQILENPEVLRSKSSAQVSFQFLGKVMIFESDNSINHAEIRWFANAPFEEFSPVFKSADVQALADLINAEELAAEARKIEEYQRLADQLRAEKQQALLSLHQANEQLGVLEDELARSRELAEQQLASSPKKSAYLLIAGMVEYITTTTRHRHTQETIIAQVSAKGWAGASETTLKHLMAEAKKVAKDAESTVFSKAEARDLATRD